MNRSDLQGATFDEVINNLVTTCNMFLEFF